MTRGASVAPAPGVPRNYHFPKAERRQLPSGTKIIVGSLSKFPLVTLTAVFHGAGAASDPAGREGLADLTASMLLEGTVDRDGNALAEYFEGLGTSLASSADWDATFVTLTVQPSRLGAAVTALRDILRAPAFPERQLTRLRAEHRAGRLQISADPRSLADEGMVWTCYDEASRYRRPIAGVISTVDAIGRDDVRSFWHDRYGPGVLTLVFAGDIDLDRATSVAHTLVDGWPEETPTPNELLVRPRYGSGQVTLIEKPGAAQAELRLGHIGVARSDRGYFPLTVMNAVLGGLFNSRINLNLRERHGYTYGASSGFDWRIHAGPWAVSTAVKSEVCGAAVREVLSEIDRMRAEPVSQDELELAAHYLVGVFPLRFETTAAVASALASQALFGLPEDYFDTYRALVAAVTPADVLRVAHDYLRPHDLQILAVGDPEILRQELSAFAAGNLRSVTTDAIETAP